jgi:hypothetical protein
MDAELESGVLRMDMLGLTYTFVVNGPRSLPLLQKEGCFII